MNKIYKVIYSKVRNCYVVVSELAKNNSKGTSRGTVVDSRKGTSLLAAVLAAGVMAFGAYGTALAAGPAAGPAAIENGTASKADGIASIAVGVGDHVVSSTTEANRYQGATSLAVGTLNIVDADASAPFDGVASSVVGQVNYTKNANAAIIMGAGNKVTNSYQAVSGLDQDTINQIMGYYQKGQMDKVTELLQKAVPNSGGQVLAIGGGNTVDYAQASQVMGVSNTLKGTKDSISKYNLVDGFQNKVTGAQSTYVVGTKNEVLNTRNTIALGDNQRLDGVKGAVVIGSADAKITMNVDNGVVIGHNAQVWHSGGTTGKTMGTGDIAIGDNAHTNNYIDQGGGIAIGQNAFVENMTGGLERSFDFNQAGYDSFLEYKYGLPHDPSKMITGVAIGQNAYARSGSVMLGTHNYKGALGDVTVDSANSKQQNGSILSTTIGTNSYSNGMFATVTGAYSIASSNYSSVAADAGKNFGATIMGSLNSIESATASNRYSGVANSIVGTANRTFNSNGSLIFGAGNEITNSVTTISAPTDGGDSAQALQQTLMRKVQTSNGGGATLAIGGGNKADYAQQSQLLGVGNTLTGTSDSVSKFNMLDGYKNTATNVSNTKIIGSNNTVNDKADSNTIVGDNHTIAAEKTNNVILGNADTDAAKTTSASDAVIIGHNASVSVDGGVALGSFSVADRDAGEKVGYDPSTQKASTEISSTWKSKLGAVSVGDATNGYTRQITNVAAGSEDTDAVNVAQLKKAVAGAKDGNDTLVSNDNALSLNGKQLSMNIKDTAGNTVSGSVDLSKIAAAVDTNTTYTLDGKDNGDNTTTISLKDNDGNASGTVTVATKDTRNTVEAGENVTLDTKDNADGSHVYKVNVKADGKVETGDTKLVSGDTVYNETRVQQDGTYVKQSNTAGQNLSALDNQVANNSSSINRLNGRVNDLDSRVNKVGAGAAALAALHPQDFNPDDKWDFAVGYGNYRDANAMAIGAFYRPDENVMFSMGTNFGNGENMINAGVTFKLGPKNHTTSNKYLLSKEVTTLRATVAQQDAQLKQQSNEIKELREMVSKLMEKAK
ncbi:ESPR-type extended signal peptide-containing protein [Acidaminococcus timonensis]|uniref:ESPR-type extended signal peptide-containing protein n=1 Tax=Acidaminococcus timonensis TaxID=1871002 RepID=UPI0025D81CFB|nr:ESPR-type extended signal peptide-containing protein [Acidaminococcus timonensis]